MSPHRRLTLALFAGGVTLLLLGGGILQHTQPPRGPAAPQLRVAGKKLPRAAQPLRPPGRE